MRFLTTLFIASLACTSALADTLTGAAWVTDGDTLKIAGETVRIHGIDAPESKQTCTRNGAEYACGKDATFFLREMLHGKEVTCETIEKDRYGRYIATCYVDGSDIAAWMVLNGHATAYRYFSKKYVIAEEAARAQKLGIHNGEYENPYDWRKKNR